MNERDILAQKDFAVKEALRKGLAEGLAEGKREIARKLLNLGDSFEKISIVTGLSEEEIKAL